MARRAIIKGSSARDLANLDDGYSPNGESQHSRRSAHAPDVKMVGHVKKRRGPRTRDELIAENVSALAKMRGDLLITTDRVRLTKLMRNIAIKAAFVERLQREKTE